MNQHERASRWSGRRTVASLLALTLYAGPLSAAYTEPRLALTRVTPYRAAGGSITLKIEGSFSFNDAVQLGLPLSVTVSQGQLTARFDLNGGVFTSTGGAAEQPAAGPGVVEVAPRALTLVLPPGFAAGAAIAQVVASYDNKPIASNRLSFAL